jgi:hypothetical protein
MSKRIAVCINVALEGQADSLRDVCYIDREYYAKIFSDLSIFNDNYLKSLAYKDRFWEPFLRVIIYYCDCLVKFEPRSKNFDPNNPSEEFLKFLGLSETDYYSLRTKWCQVTRRQVGNTGPAFMDVQLRDYYLTECNFKSDKPQKLLAFKKSYMGSSHLY